MTADVERRLLQGATLLACLVPLTAGSSGVLESAAMLRGVSEPLAVDLDSHFRYLSGLLLGIGLVFLSAIPRIETKGTVFRVLGALIVVGGLARLLSLIEEGAPGPGHQFGLAMELVVTPLLVMWQARVACRFGAPASPARRFTD